MDALEEIDFWSDCLDEESQHVRQRVLVIVEQVWTTRYGFVLEMTVRRTNTMRKMR